MTEKKLEKGWLWDQMQMNSKLIRVKNLVFSPVFKVVCKFFNLTLFQDISFLVPLTMNSNLGMNLQICFMNEASSDTEFPNAEKEVFVNSTRSIVSGQNHHVLGKNLIPQGLSLPPLRLDFTSSSSPIDEADFFARQTRLQMEARIALSQAKEMAHMQVEVERQKLKHSPITEMVRSSLAKVFGLVLH